MWRAYQGIFFGIWTRRSARSAEATTECATWLFVPVDVFDHLGIPVDKDAHNLISIILNNKFDILIERKFLHNLVSTAIKTVESQPTLIELTGEAKVFGDIHRYLDGLLTLFQKTGSPITKYQEDIKYLFLRI